MPRIRISISRATSRLKLKTSLSSIFYCGLCTRTKSLSRWLAVVTLNHEHVELPTYQLLLQVHMSRMKFKMAYSGQQLHCSPSSSAPLHCPKHVGNCFQQCFLSTSRNNNSKMHSYRGDPAPNHTSRDSCSGRESNEQNCFPLMVSKLLP